MTRPTRVMCNSDALFHNLMQVKQIAPCQKIMAMVKANAYGCGIANIIPTLEGQVDYYGVACSEEAMAIRHLGSLTEIVLMEGVFESSEYSAAAQSGFQCVIHQKQQLDWLIKTPLNTPIKVWIKVDTGMHRLGFDRREVDDVFKALEKCSWVIPDYGVMTHFSSADLIGHEVNTKQLQEFNNLVLKKACQRSLANSAAILTLPESHADVIRPGIMLYGISPFSERSGQELGLEPVMRFVTALSAIHHYPEKSSIGYNGIWTSNQPCVIGVIPAGYADGYPRTISADTPVWINNTIAPIVGRVSMDMITIDLTQVPNPKIGDEVELWGKHIPIEKVAKSAGTIAYELITKITPRVRVEG